MPPIIQVSNLSKSYTITHEGKERYTALRDVMAQKVKKIFSFPGWKAKTGITKEEFWALKDINFEIEQGDRVGIIGRNGAGKSTLLKILSRITEPTTGSIKIKGRVASLLEVGTGFHPELTGRENIFLNGAILGMSREEIRKHFDAIVDFSEIEKFLDTPVKRYSSGMYVRLAFAVAAHLEPEILVVDEVLAVGDIEFQKKCLGKMEDVSKKGGRTVLFVSHNMASVKALCNRGIVLSKGSVMFKGSSIDAVSFYLDDTVSEISEEKNWDDESKAPGNNNIKLKQVMVTPVRGEIVSVSSGFWLTVKFMNYKSGVRIGFNIRLITKDEIVVFEIGKVISPDSDSKTAMYIVKIEIPPYLLNSNFYKVKLFFGESGTLICDLPDDLFIFEVQNSITIGENPNQIPGVIKPKLNFQVSLETKI